MDLYKPRGNSQPRRPTDNNQWRCNQHTTLFTIWWIVWSYKSINERYAGRETSRR